jgi:hypothetical protein
MTGAIALPRHIVDQLRAERGGIVDLAVETGRMKVIDEQKVDEHETITRKPN